MVYAEDDWYAAIGQVALSANVLDDVLRDVVAGLLGTRLGHVMAAGEPTSALIDKCERLAVYRDPLPDERRRELLEVLRRAKPLAKQRNQIVHSMWRWDQHPERLHGRRSRRHRLLLSESTWTIPEMIAVANSTTSVAAELEGICSEAFWGDQRHDMRAEPRRDETA